MAKKLTYEELEQRVKILEKESFELKQAEEDLKHQQRRLESLIEHSSLAIVTLDERHNIIACNRDFEKLFYLSESEIIGINLDELIVDQESIEDARSYTKQTLIGKAIYGSGKRQRKDGARIYVEFIGVPVIIDGKVMGAYGIYRDISERKRAEEALQESEERYRSFVQNFQGIAFRGTMDFKPIFFDGAVKKITGYTEQELISGNSSWNQVIHTDDLSALLTKEEKKLHTDPNYAYERDYRIVRKDGQVRWVHEIIQNVCDDQGKPAMVQGAIYDVTENRKTEAAMRESEEKYRTLYESSRDAIMTLAPPTWLFTSGNPATVELFKVKDEAQFISLGPWQLSPEKQPDGKPSAEKVKEMIETAMRNGSHFFEWTHCHLDGTPFPAEVLLTRMEQRGQVLLQATVRDITERKRAEKEKQALEVQLRQSQKLESIGNLAGGIAHDFNNILSSIIGFTELALDDVTKGTPMEDNLQEVYAAGKRARDLIKQILTFARQSDEERRKPIQMVTVAEEALKLIRSTIPTSIEIRQKLESNSLIMGNPTKVHQLFMNLCTNAAQAMEERGGIMEIGLADVEVDDRSSLIQSGLKPDNYIKMTVSDTGSGIDPSIIGSIFEPYFTTKGVGEGTGIGLALVHGIVEAYGGKITVESKLGKGTVFSIYLPIVKKHEDYRPYEEEKLPSGTERILFVDDELPIAKMGSQILERLGYQVTVRTSSVEALELFRSKPNDFDLVISDMTMPNMTGDELAMELMRIRSDIPVILCTGYSKKISGDSASAIGIKAFAYKPVVKAELAKTVRKVLDEAQGSVQG